jgi:hypothetical protein
MRFTALLSPLMVSCSPVNVLWGEVKENDYRSSDYPLTFSRMETTFQIRDRV